MINRINDVTMMFNVAMILSAPAEVRKQIQRPTPLAGCDLFSAPCCGACRLDFCGCLMVSSHLMPLQV